MGGELSPDRMFHGGSPIPIEGFGTHLPEHDDPLVEVDAIDPALHPGGVFSLPQEQREAFAESLGGPRFLEKIRAESRLRHPASNDPPHVRP